ncbi:MAG: hypothetical protein ABJB86_08940 [Bacteroidota bacterium]
MKYFLIALTCILIMTIVGACKKVDAGPAGPAGPAGATGPAGIAGNANATQYIFPSHNFRDGADAVLTVNTTEDTVNRSAWFVYLIYARSSGYPVPGFGYDNLAQYGMSWVYDQKAIFTITRIAGQGENYLNIRIVRIYTNSSTGDRTKRSLPDIDFNDYDAVRRYYQLPV